MSSPSDKVTIELPRVRPEEKPTLEMASLPIILGEMREFRQERIAHDAQTGQRFETLDNSVKSLAMQVQSNYELHGGKIRALEVRVEALEGEKAKVIAAFLALEEEKKKIYAQIAALRSGASTEELAQIAQHVSLTEEQIAARLAAENARGGMVEAKVDMLAGIVAQGLGVRMPTPRPDGSIPPASEAKPQKSLLQQNTFWTKVAAVMGGLIVMAGSLDKMGAFEELGKLVSKALGH